MLIPLGTGIARGRGVERERLVEVVEGKGYLGGGVE
jgi:hypothetical protein